MFFRTQSGSEYEVNLVTKRIRRLKGNRPPTSHQRTDGEWRDYLSLMSEPDYDPETAAHVSRLPEVGEPILIVWPEMSVRQLGTHQRTLTSKVVEVFS